MKTGFSIINIIIIIGLISLAYLGYTQSLDDRVKKILSSSGSPSSPLIAPKKSEPAATNKPPVKNTSAINPVQPIKTPETEKILPPAGKKGYYENLTYFYQINFPEDWPIKVRSAGNVSLGTTPPRNGQGSITIEISTGADDELEQAKAEAKRYAGIISITEEPIVLGGVSGNKITIHNLMAKTKTVNLLLSKSNLNYIIKYSEESTEFVSQVNRALMTFKFTK